MENENHVAKGYWVTKIHLDQWFSTGVPRERQYSVWICGWGSAGRAYNAPPGSL